MGHWYKDYVDGGGKTFDVCKIDVYRDGGTIGIKTKWFDGSGIGQWVFDEYRVSKDLDKLTLKGVEIKDESTKIYLLERVGRYIEGLNHEIILAKKVERYLNE